MKLRPLRKVAGALAGLLLVASTPAHAGTDECFRHAAVRRHINVDLLYAIARVESHYDPAATNAKSHAIGMMQILPWHLKWLQKYGISREDLYEACTNINVGAFILADFVRMYGYTWRAVGAYGVGMEKGKDSARIAYAQLVERAYVRISRGGVEKVSAPGDQRGAALLQSGTLSARPVMVSE